MKKCGNLKNRLLLPSALLVWVALGAALTGCGESNIPNDAIPSQAIHYFGTANPAGTGYDRSGGVWSVTLDKNTGYFSYENVDTSTVDAQNPVPDVGSFSISPNGILDLTLSQQATGSGGYAVILPGEGFLMRTGSSLTDVNGASPSALIGGTISNNCPAFTSPQTYNFIAEGTTQGGDSITHVAYGAIQIAAGGAGSWHYSNFTMFDLSGNALSPAPLPDATCPSTQAGYTLVSPLHNVSPNGEPDGPAQVTVGVSPSGLLAIDEGQGGNNTALWNFGPTGPIGLLGVIKPAAALNVSDIVSKSYAGLESDPLSPLGTVAVAFGTSPGKGTVMTGGGFPNDDVTKSPLTNLTLDLGTQSSQTPGLFPAVTLTTPDTYGVCAGTPSGGADSNGNPICIFHGAAVAGQVGGKYVIFTNINDPTARYKAFVSPLAVINLALYQQ